MKQWFCPNYQDTGNESEHNIKPQTSVSHGLNWRHNTTAPYLNLMLVLIHPYSLRLLEHD